MIHDLDCERARRTLEERLDERVDSERARHLRDHLERCPRCREHEEGLLLVRRALGALPVVPFPDEALAAVWRRTIEAEAHPSRASRLDWRSAVAAALVAAAALFSLQLGGGRRGGPTDAEIARAARETRLVFALTARAMRRSERAAVDQVLAKEVSPAVRRIPLRWPEDQTVDSRRSGT
jgi:predicted anti-sigma-YlaC factor YlaD